MVIQIIDCSGSPYEIGRAHGSKAFSLIHASIDFYAGLFQKTAAMGWNAVRETAATFEAPLKAKWPHLLEEMQGVADGASRDLVDIIALNVRTEIAFGLFSDGCTSLAWKTPGAMFLAQNWDWMEEQKPNIVLLCVRQHGLPSIKMLTEAGIIGKIGINSAGVGVCVNAIRAKGLDPARLPTHLALRMALNSTSMQAAKESLERHGVASSCHILLGDKTGAVGMEWSHIGCKPIPLTDNRIHHANHLLLDHPGVVDSQWLPDSFQRVDRIQELTAKISDPSLGDVQELFKDETNLPGAICREQKGVSQAATLFNIVMDLTSIKAEVLMGRPSQPDQRLTLDFSDQ